MLIYNDLIILSEFNGVLTTALWFAVKRNVSYVRYDKYCVFKIVEICGSAKLEALHNFRAINCLVLSTSKIWFGSSNTNNVYI